MAMNPESRESGFIAPLRPGMTLRKKPAVMGDGRLFSGAQKVLRPLRHATLTICVVEEAFRRLRG
jgi:hypothetical protein